MVSDNTMPEQQASSHPSVEVMWNDYCATLGDAAAAVRAGGYEAWHFDDSEGSANELAELVLAGRKRATASLPWTFEAEGAPLPAIGSHSVVTDWSGVAVCVIRTVKTEIVAFGRVTPEFAAREGEGDRSLAYWRRAHTAFFGRECARLGRAVDEETPVLCEEFELVYPRRA